MKKKELFFGIICGIIGIVFSIPLIIVTFMWGDILQIIMIAIIILIFLTYFTRLILYKFKPYNKLFYVYLTEALFLILTVIMSLGDFLATLESLMQYHFGIWLIFMSDYLIGQFVKSKIETSQKQTNE
ncbi:MAG TPA: hypothetical protein PK675_04530 [Clostridia bacterium]|nr:hypothetical protein [Clostridia bacterium]